ncbi:aminoglycoside phosphotransferase family protein [Oceanidesulfovibrio indonesiensis]|uniref:Aminoglycoside phosphotransferase family protein n=1 Tax=Oceanidesulfovibrio indonesiensis TaxID=54767 RepID=A0A7M3MCX2_9BACT|nr:aminoglycoside phosphotransferase family protein [Oceanidesulfovibrio indonesiensis]TVM16368.1 aminoglycoside phosphotransferase family protein [Oceanidesulfovibrio indonesiensis]
MGNDTIHRISRFLREVRWVPEALKPDDITFLAAGEYNENYRVRTGAGDYVFRINHGSQIGQDRQIEYEYTVLRLIEDSGLTPRPFYCRPDAPGLGGVLLMEHLPGRPLDYERDGKAAARLFARIHSLPSPVQAMQQHGPEALPEIRLGPDGPKRTPPPLIIQRTPVADIAAESYGLLSRYPDHARKNEGKRILEYYAEVLALAQEADQIFETEPLILVNTEVNSGNFLVQENTVRLVDWEKAVLSCRYQDLAHFLIPTTTQWKSDFTYTPSARREFLHTYLNALEEYDGLPPAGLTLDELDERTRIMERTILLRALSWCYMAWHEYTSSDRPLTNAHTFRTMERYLENVDAILDGA